MSGSAFDRVDDLVQLLILRQAGGRARLEQRLDLARIRRRGEADDRDVRTSLAERLGDLNSVDAGSR